MDLSLSKKQQATVAAAITLFCAVFILFFLGTLFWLLGTMVVRFSNVLLPLAVAGALALILKPYYAWLTKKCRGHGLPAVILVYVSILLPLLLLLVLVGGKVAAELADFLVQLSVWGREVAQSIQENMPALQALWEEHGLQTKMTTALEEHGGAILAGITDFGTLLASGVHNVFLWITGMFGWAVLPVYLAFMLMAKPLKRSQVEGLLPFLKKDTRDDVIYLGEEFVNIVVAFFRGQLLVALAQGVLFAIGFVMVGLQYGLTLGLVLGFLNIVPYLGSMVGLSIAIPLAFFQDGGGIMKVVLVLTVFTSVQCIEGYYLTPKIMGERTGLHPLMIIVAIFFWGSVFGGITGMVLAIPLTAFLVVFWRLAKSKYIQEIV